MYTSTKQTASSSKRRVLMMGGLLALLALLGVAAKVFPRVTSDFQKSYWGLNAAHYQRLIDRFPREFQMEIEDRLSDIDDSKRSRAPTIEPGSGRIQAHTEIIAAPPRSGGEIRYTLDGSIPTAQSPLWAGNLQIEERLLLRARVFEVGSEPSRVVTRAYVTGLDDSLPVLSLAIDPVHLNDRRVGILSNPEGRGRMWERPAVLSLFPAGQQAAQDEEIKIRIHGNASRKYLDRKRFRLYTPNPTSLVRPELQEIVGGGADFSDTWLLHQSSMWQIYRQKLGNRVAHAMGLITPPSAQCILLVNGELWGVSDLVARPDARLVAGRENPAGVTLLKVSLAKPDVVMGSRKEWDSFYETLEKWHPHDDKYYQNLESLFDMEGLMDLWIYFIFVADIDRPHNNMDFFTDSEGDRQWRFLVYDTDVAFNYRGEFVEHDTLSWHLRDEPRQDLVNARLLIDSPKLVQSTLLFRKLMAREDFRRRFRIRFENHLEGALSSSQTLEIFDGILNQLEPFREVERSGFTGKVREDWAEMRETEIAFIRTFLERRPGVVRGLLNEYFSNIGK